jgi:hypothetical protein
MTILLNSFKLGAAIALLSTLYSLNVQAADLVGLHFPVAFKDSVQFFSDVSALPVRLVRIHQASVGERLCDGDWPLWLETEGAWSWPVDSYTRLYALPCPQASGRVLWRFYTEFAEHDVDQNGLFRQVNFSTLDLEKHWSSSSVIQNWHWQPDVQELQAAYLYDGRYDCGSLQTYKWSAIYFTFKIEKAYIKACDTSLPLIYPEKTE